MGPDKFELQLKGFGVAVLGILNQEHHEEGDDRSTGIDDERPTTGLSKPRLAVPLWGLHQSENA
jgi:hypothetical protein